MAQPYTENKNKIIIQGSCEVIPINLLVLIDTASIASLINPKIIDFVGKPNNIKQSEPLHNYNRSYR